LSATPQQLEYFADFFKALAHPTRVFIVEQLADEEKCVCELTAMIDADISTVSRHLAVLKNTGIVSASKRANQVFYQLRTPCILNFLKCIRGLQETG
jgi:DNA-binding transcriptional ArsR family regulator